MEIKAKPKYRNVAEDLVRIARMVKRGDDNKYFVSYLEELCSLIGAGSNITKLNDPSIGGYYHEVIYKGIKFISMSKEPIAPYINSYLEG